MSFVGLFYQDGETFGGQDVLLPDLVLIQLMHQIYYQVNLGLFMVKQAEPLLMKNGLLQLVEDSMRKKKF